MSDSLLSYVVDQLHRVKGQWSVVAKKTRISKRTIQKIASGEIEDPGVRKIETLAKYFRGKRSSSARYEARA